MRKAICWILMTLLMLPVMAQAQEYFTLSQVREQAAAGWHETYTDKYGRETVVDIDVEVFGEEVAPVLKVRFAGYDVDTSLLPEGTQGRNDGSIVLYLNDPARAVFGTKSGEAHLIVHRSYGEKVEMDRVYMPEYGTPLTIREMVDHHTAILSKLDIPTDCYVFDQPFDFSVRTKIRKSSGEVVEPAIYLAHFWQQMHGLPILNHVADAFTNAVARELWAFPQAVFGMREEDEFQITVREMEELDLLSSDVPLCSFAQVKAGIEQLIEEGHVQRVLSMKLGLVLYNGTQTFSDVNSIFEADCYYAVPMWVVDCVYMDNGKKSYSESGPRSDELNPDVRTGPNFETLYINTQTGEIVDREAKGTNRSQYTGFVSWDDVR